LPVAFHTSGRLFTGYLKADYVFNGATFEAGTLIRFNEDGRVQSGTLKADTAFGARTFLKGPIEFYPNGAVQRGLVGAGFTDDNLTIPLNAQITLAGNGRVTGISPTVNPPRYRLLGRTVRGDAGLAFDGNPGLYRLISSSAGEQMLIARFVAKRSQLGTPFAIVPVVVPVGTNFRLSTVDPAQIAGGQTNDIWVPERFAFNGWEFGTNPRLFVRDMRLVGIQVTQNLTIGGHAFRAGRMVLFDDNGRIIPPAELEEIPT
jgi:hypothetical protein